MHSLFSRIKTSYFLFNLFQASGFLTFSGGIEMEHNFEMGCDFWFNSLQYDL